MDFSQDYSPPKSQKFRILIASDLHLGFAERDPLRGDDTFNTFEEILQTAREKEVDFLLLGGDLFHENKPSSKTMTRCVELLRKYCMGSEPINFEVVSEQKENFIHTELFPVVNYEDSNLNISLPVFSIHGNHDDPVGKDHLCALETISAAGLINYFGKQLDMEKIKVSPILMKKGDYKLALYGLGFLPEERLHRMFYNNKIEILCPEDRDSWFKVFVVHQNRVKRGKKYLPEKFLTELPDLVVWGHEHESCVDQEWNTERNFHVYQPGSTVVTSLCPGEAKSKSIGLLEFYTDVDNFRQQITPIPLKTARKLFFEDVDLDEALSDSAVALSEETAFKFCSQKVEDILDLALAEHSGDEVQPKEPLVRLRVEYSNEYHTFSVAQFGQQFVGRVANPKEIILFKSRKLRREAEDVDVDLDKLEGLMEVDQTVRCDIEDVVRDYFRNAAEKDKMSLLDEDVLTSGIKMLVEKDASVDVITKIIDYSLDKGIKQLAAQDDLSYDDKKCVTEACRLHKEQLRASSNEEINGYLKKIVKGARSETPANSDSDEETQITVKASTASKTRGRATGAKSPRSRGRDRGRGRGRGRGKSSYYESDDEVEIA